MMSPRGANKKRRVLWLGLGCLPFLMPAAVLGQLLSGYSLPAKELAGPTQSVTSTDPIWVVDYHNLVLDYRASGGTDPNAAVLTLRPGSVGPITPRANNPENPLASGEDVVAVRGRDLIFDGHPHTLRIDLNGKVKTPQIDSLRFALPAGARLNIARMQFLADPGFLPCTASKGDDMPADSQLLPVHGPLSCDGAPATSLRGRESIIIDAGAKQGTTLYMDLLSYLAGFTNYVPSAPLRPSATSDTSLVIATLRYADHSSVIEQQFPLLVSQHRHTLLNQKRSLYALRLDPSRRLLSVELADRSPHVQLVLFRAAISNHTEESNDEQGVPISTSAMNSQCNAAATLGVSEWFQVSDGSGKQVDTVRAALDRTPSPQGLTLSLELTNTGNRDVDVVLLFPSLNIHVSDDSQDVSYLFPQKVTTISSQDATLSADYGPNFLLQFTDVFATHAGCGAAVVVEDTSGRVKDLHSQEREGLGF